MNILTELENKHILYWQDEAYLAVQPIIMKAPPDMDDCSDCVAVSTVDHFGRSVIRVPWKPNEIELMQMAQGGTIWLSCWGGLPPHMLEVQE